MKVNRATPPVSVVPVLFYPDVRAAVTWLTSAFGFVERTRIGESECTVEDPAGHRWQFAETTGDVAPEEFGCRTVAPWPDAAERG